MGAAAYNRGTKLIGELISREDRPAEFVFMDDLNALPKNDGAAKPFGPIHFVNSHGGWWAECPTTGYGYFYKTLRQAIRAWRVSINELKGGVYIGVPA